MAAGLRRAVTLTQRPHPFAVLVRTRAAAVSEELLELAELVEYTERPPAGWVAAVHELLTDGCNSPLYDPQGHISELRATLHYLTRPWLDTWDESRTASLSMTSSASAPEAGRRRAKESPQAPGDGSLTPHLHPGQTASKGHRRTLGS